MVTTSAKVPLGYEAESGEPVQVPLTHTFIAATTGKGKSVTAEALINRAKEKGLRIIVIDPKDPPDYRGIGSEHPLLIKGVSDPLTIKRLLESSSKLWLRRELPELIQVCKEGDSWTSVLEKVREKKAGRVHPVVKERLEVLELLLSKLVEEMKPLKIRDFVSFEDSVLRIGMQGLSLGLQQLCVKDLAEYILEHFTDVILFIDEFHRFVPRATPSAARESLVRLIQEGRAKGVWLWGCNQTITTVDEQVRKQMQLWLLGGQTELNEADRVLNQLLPPTRLTRQDVYRLKIGFFVVNNFLEGRSRVAYVQPFWLTEELARKVALGEQSVESVVRVTPVFEEDDLALREENERLKEQVDLLATKVNGLEAGLESAREVRNKVLRERDELLEKVEILEGELERLKSLDEVLERLAAPIIDMVVQDFEDKWATKIASQVQENLDQKLKEEVEGIIEQTKTELAEIKRTVGTPKIKRKVIVEHTPAFTPRLDKGPYAAWLKKLPKGSSMVFQTLLEHQGQLTFDQLSILTGKSKNNLKTHLLPPLRKADLIATYGSNIKVRTL